MMNRMATPAFVCLALLVGGAACTRKPSTTTTTTTATTATATSTSTAAKTKPVVERGHQIYGKLCALCHGADARGYAADNAPSLRTPTFLATASDDFLRAGIERGRPGTAMAGYAQSVGGPLSP